MAKIKINKKEASKDLTMKKLCRSGLAVFSKYGFDSATTKMISQHAGINESLITRYFNGKAGLLEAVIKEFAQDIHNQYSTYPAGKTIEDELRSFLTATTTSLQGNVRFMKLAFSRAILDSTMQKRLNRDLKSPGDELFIKRLKDFQKQGQYPHSRSPEETLEMLKIFIRGIVFDRIALSCSSALSVPDAIEYIVRAISADLASAKK